MDLNVPDGYIESKEYGIRRIVKKDKEGNPALFEDICYTPIQIRRVLKNYDSGETSIEVIFFDAKGKLACHTMQMGELFQKKGIMQLAGFGVMVTDKKATALAEYLNKFLFVNKATIPEQKLYETLGWKNNHASFVLGKEEILADKVEPVTLTNAPTSITNAISKGGTLEGWLKCTRPLLRYPRVRFKCYLSCTAPLLSVLEEKSKLVNDYGESSKGKTTSNEAGISIWGNPDLLNLSAISTKVGAEETVKLFSNIPINLDEIQATEPELFTQIVYMIGNESGKLRGKKTGGLRDVAHWKTIVLVTGEAPISNDKSFTGTKVRAIETSGGIGEDNEESKRAVEIFEDGDKDANGKFEGGITKHYGHIAPILIQKILKNKEQLPEMYAESLKKLSSISSDKKGAIADRMRKIFASFIVGGMLFEEIMKEQGEETQDPYAVCEEVLKTVIDEIVDETYATRAISHIYSWVDNKRKFFMTEGVSDERAPSDIYGNFNGIFELEIYTRPLKKELKEAGFNYQRVMKDFANLGWLKAANAQIWTNKNGRGIKLDCAKIYEYTEMDSPYFKPNAAEQATKDGWIIQTK